MAEKLDILQGTLDLMVLRTLSSLGELHGYGIARRIEQLSGNSVLLNQGTIHVSLVRLERQGWIKAKWGVSENNRRAKFYAITPSGKKQLTKETSDWERMTAIVSLVLAGGKTT